MPSKLILKMVNRPKSEAFNQSREGRPNVGPAFMPGARGGNHPGKAPSGAARRRFPFYPFIPKEIFHHIQSGISSESPGILPHMFCCDDVFSGCVYISLCWLTRKSPVRGGPPIPADNDYQKSINLFRIEAETEEINGLLLQHSL